MLQLAWHTAESVNFVDGSGSYEIRHKMPFRTIFEYDVFLAEVANHLRRWRQK